MSARWKRAADTLPPPADVAKNNLALLQETDEIAMNPALWGPLHGRIEDRLTKAPIPWKPTVLQRRMIRHYLYCQDADVPCRQCVVKIRRGGGSTGAAGLLYVHLHNYRARAGVIGTDYEVSANLLAMLKHFDRHDRFEGWKRASKVIDDLMEWPNTSKVQRYTAENPEASRSAGLQAYHASEVARWQDTPGTSAKETLRSLRGSVPRQGFTFACEESTANGASGAHFETFDKGRWPTHIELGCEAGKEYWRQWEDETPQNTLDLGGDLQFVRVFAGWFEDDEAKMPCTLREVQLIRSTLDEHETELIRRYQREGPNGPRLGNIVDASVWEQLKWRREVIMHEFDGDREAYDQENPHSCAAAFRSSGRHTFNRAGCAVMTEQGKVRPPMLGILSEQHGGDVVFTRTEAGEAWVQLWEEPREGYRYVEGVDTMSGVEQIGGSNVADFNGAGVLRAAFRDDDDVKRPPRVVAELMPKSQVDPDVLVHQTGLLSKYYGNCLIVFEVNNTGHGYLALAKTKGLNLYRRERPDKRTQEVTEHLGWETTPKTRPQLISCLQAAVRMNARDETRGDGLECYSATTNAQFTAMIKDAKGVDKAPSGKHDDNILYVGMALVNITAATYYAGRKRKRRGPADRADWRKR